MAEVINKSLQEQKNTFLLQLLEDAEKDFSDVPASEESIGF